MKIAEVFCGIFKCECIKWIDTFSDKKLKSHVNQMKQDQ
jgi:hypothetical protein